MKYSFALIFTLTLAMPAWPQSTVPLNTWEGSDQCSLKKYVAEYNRRNPPTELFIEDLTRVAAAGNPSVLTKIDHDENTSYLAANVVRCLASPSMFSPFRLENTLKEAYELYLSDRNSRRAMWAFFTQLDAAYLTEDQRIAAQQNRTSYKVNFMKGAVYGVSASTLVLWLARRGRPPAVALPSSEALAPIVKGLNSSQVYPILTKVMAFKNWTWSFVEFGGAVAGGGTIIGTPMYYARKHGLLPTRTEDSRTEAERIHHRMHWLELDCRARSLQKELEERVYQGDKDPQLSKDIRRVNYLLNDLNFLNDVSQLYYVENDPLKEMVIGENSVSYQKSIVECAVGFSKKNPLKVTIGDVQNVVRAVGVHFLDLYAPVLVKPVADRLVNFFADEKDGFAQGLAGASPRIKEFFAHVQNRLPRPEENVENVVERTTSYSGVLIRLNGRDEFLKEWSELLSKIPADLQAKIAEEARNMIGTLPAPLFNQLVLDLLYEKSFRPANIIFFFNMGFALEEAAKKQMIPSTKGYLLPHEMMFYIHGPIDQTPAFGPPDESYE